jgi:hypothetical protein
MACAPTNKGNNVSDNLQVNASHISDQDIRKLENGQSKMMGCDISCEYIHQHNFTNISNDVIL